MGATAPYSLRQQCHEADPGRHQHCCPTQRLTPQTRESVQAGVFMLFAMCRRAGAITLLGMWIVLPAGAGTACEAQLSAAQRARFSMAVQGCVAAAQAAPAPAERHAD